MRTRKHGTRVKRRKVKSKKRGGTTFHSLRLRDALITIREYVTETNDKAVNEFLYDIRNRILKSRGLGVMSVDDLLLNLDNNTRIQLECSPMETIILISASNHDFPAELVDDIHKIIRTKKSNRAPEP